MGTLTPDTSLVAYCGLYCGSCRSNKKGKCPGCHENEKAKWCKVRSCCMDNGFASCADCTFFENPEDCKKINNLIGKAFALIFRSNRLGSIELIKKIGHDEFAVKMADKGSMTVNR